MGGHFALTIQRLCLACYAPPEVALSPPSTVNDRNETDHQYQATKRPPGKPLHENSPLWTVTPSSGNARPMAADEDNLRKGCAPSNDLSPSKGQSTLPHHGVV